MTNTQPSGFKPTAPFTVVDDLLGCQVPATVVLDGHLVAFEGETEPTQELSLLEHLVLGSRIQATYLQDNTQFRLR